MDSVWRVLIEFDKSHPWPVVRASELSKWPAGGFYGKILDGHYQRRARSLIADGDRPAVAGEEATEALAADSEEAIGRALQRSYGVHVAPRIPEQPLQAAIGAFVEQLDKGERIVAFLDQTLSGNGERGVVLTDRRVTASSRPMKGVYYRDIRALERSGGGILSSPGLTVEGLELKFHTRAIRDAFAEAIMEAVTIYRGEPPRAE